MGYCQLCDKIVTGYIWNLQIFTGREDGSADGLNLGERK